MDLAAQLPLLLGMAWLLPLVSFVLIVFFGSRMGAGGRGAAYVATGALLAGVVLSVIALAGWIGTHGLGDSHSSGHDAHAPHNTAAEVTHAESGHSESGLADASHTDAAHAEVGTHPYYDGDWYTLAEFGSLKLTIGYYIDTLTLVMFCMITIIATCIHFYAMGYMHEELHDVTDHEITLANGEHLQRKGRYHRFFQYLSLFCFSMLGVVIAGNLAMTFIFWELVGICSYFLIGFYFERKSASTAANKAFIVNRVGDFGMLIGMMALFTSLGTFHYGGDDGIFAQVRPGDDHALTAAAFVPAAEAAGAEDPQHAAYVLLVIAGVGIFCGCVGKSAQFPLHVWLPDAMEGPTPVSALVHSATMVAAGVFLVGRFYPVFAPEVLLVIAVIGCITLFMAATIAITATDIKRVLAYSTLSQLGYMMFALGVGGWVAGMLHLITHAFFKSLLFMCSGSVIHAVHTNEMPEMGGLLKKMPITGITMLVGCLAIIGAGVPTIVGLSGYYSKDAIIAQALHFSNHNAAMRVMLFVAAGGAAITAFYMFRLWFMTFLGRPRDAHRFEQAHESPKVMWIPLVVLSVFAALVATPDVREFLNPASSPVVRLLEQSRPLGIHTDAVGALVTVTMPAEHGSHAAEIHTSAGWIAFGTAASGFLLACCIYWWRLIDPSEVSTMFSPLYRFLVHKWWFDELYDFLFVRPTKWIGQIASGCDRNAIDWCVDNGARAACAFSTGFDRWIDQTFVDGLVNGVARWTHTVGLSLRKVQTGKIRQYVVLIVVATVAMFLVATFGIQK